MLFNKQSAYQLEYARPHPCPLPQQREINNSRAMKCTVNVSDFRLGIGHFLPVRNKSSST